MKRCAAHQLHVVVPLTDHPLGGFTNDGESLDHQRVQLLPVVETVAEIGGAAAQVAIGERFHLRLERADFWDEVGEGADFASLTGPKNFV